ncbi:hypothetical protein Hanom_Chr10g00957181 [Helianthus anomalus]
MTAMGPRRNSSGARRLPTTHRTGTRWRRRRREQIAGERAVGFRMDALPEAMLWSVFL